ncbi:tyrosine-type recombinase/integrase [Vibrio cholerae]|uniref:Integrase n=2 Tax=Vibrio splendidus TaxID=29497 RepID=A0A2T5EJU6_VIBSP|nr:tyrosine-type recombinase/integrase [Vibrio cholerae]OEE59637.1 integrase [Vibrio splendidus FF-6]PTP20523.1 integrase [Vibrio splendidus]
MKRRETNMEYHANNIITAEQQGELITAEQIKSSIKTNAASAYLLSLRSKLSRQKMGYFLNNVAKMTGNQSMFHCDWGTMKRHHVQGIIDLLIDAGRAPDTINTYLAGLKGVALEAWTMKQIDMESYHHIKQIKNVRGERIPKGRALERHEVAQLFKVCDEDSRCKGVRDSAIFGVLLGCGLRRSEIVALDLGHINWREQAITVMGKGNKERLAFMPDGTLRRLKLWVNDVRGEQPGPLFPRIRRHDDVQDSRMTDQAIYEILRTRRMEAGLEHCSPHDLRRTYANDLLETGVDIMTLKDMMGHASVTTTQRYIRIKDEQMRNASKRLVI